MRYIITRQTISWNEDFAFIRKKMRNGELKQPFIILIAQVANSVKRGCPHIHVNFPTLYSFIPVALYSNKEFTIVFVEDAREDPSIEVVFETHASILSRRFFSASTMDMSCIKFISHISAKDNLDSIKLKAILSGFTIDEWSPRN